MHEPDSDPLGRLIASAVNRFKHIPVGREWWLTVRAITEALAEIGMIAMLGFRFAAAIIRITTGLTRRRSP
jgi:hypothetical protein